MSGAGLAASRLHKWPWAHSQDTLSWAACTIQCPGRRPCSRGLPRRGGGQWAGRAGQEGAVRTELRVPGAGRGRGRTPGRATPVRGAGGCSASRAAEAPRLTASAGRGQRRRLPCAGAGTWRAWPGETVGPAARPASTYPTCHRLLQRAGGGHLRDGHLRSARRPASPTGARPLPRAAPALTGPRGRSCRPRSPASPAGTGVSWARRGAQTRPRSPAPRSPATHLRQRQERQQQPQEPAGGRRPAEHTGRGRGARARPPPLYEAPPRAGPAPPCGPAPAPPRVP